MNGVATARKKRVGERSPAFLDHFPQLLLTTYWWRYVTVNIIQRLFADIYATATPRTAQLHLRTLEQSGYLKPPVQLGPNEPYIYSVTSKARHLLRDQFPSSTILDTREEASQRDFLNHELTVSKIQTNLHLAVTAHPDVTIGHFERRYFHDANQLTFRDVEGKSTNLEPDLTARFHIKSKDGPFPLLYFVEVDMGTEGPAAFTNKLTKYARWYDQVGENYLLNLYRRLSKHSRRSAFRLLITTSSRRGNTDQARLRQFYDLVAKQPKPICENTRLTTTDAALARNILTDPIWQPVKLNTTPHQRSLFREP